MEIYVKNIELVGQMLLSIDNLNHLSRINLWVIEMEGFTNRT